MKKSLMKNLKTSISEVMETMFFISVNIKETSSIEDSGILKIDDIKICLLNFKGTISGIFLLYVPESFLKIMVINFLGIDEEKIENEHITGVIKESINIIAGNMFSKLDKSNEIQIDIPELLNNETLPKQISNNKNKECFVIESNEGIAVMSFLMDN